MFLVILILSLNVFLAVDWTAVTATIGAVFLALSFAYQETMQQLFDSLYMLFFVRPFNVTDRIIVTNNETAYSRSNGQNEWEELVVEEVGVMTTLFHNASNGSAVYLRNSTLVNSTLVNLSRGGRVQIVFDMGVKIETKEKTLGDLKHKVERLLFADPIFSPKIHLWIEKVEHGKYGGQTIRISVKSRQKWRPRAHDWKEFRSHLMAQVNEIMLEMDIADE